MRSVTRGILPARGAYEQWRAAASGLSVELFAGDEIAKGYAEARPAVHSAVVGQAFAQLEAASRRHRILDVGHAYNEFARRWPRPTDCRHAIDAGVLGAAGFSIGSGEPMTVPIAMNANAYVAYLMTETNVAAAVQRGEPAARVRQWCVERFSPLLTASRVVDFDAWYAIVTPSG